VNINVYIHSGGGDLFSGICAMNYIENMKVHVNTIIDGYVASAASLIALGGHTVYMNKYSILLIHQITSGFYGKYDEVIDEVDNTKTSMRMMKTIYEEKTNIPKDILDEYLKKDIYIESCDCKKYDIIDVIF
jgi:ATP-dependent protease ClpP protease subunit